jgi:hypothetical protein
LTVTIDCAHVEKSRTEQSPQERTRKIEELKELCGEGEFCLTDEEAGRALDLCNGDEQQAAASLTGELGASFRRKCMEPERIAEMKEERRRERSVAKKGLKWHAMPDPKMRGKPVDRSQLEGHIFVGAFRGKGFQGNGRSGKTVLRKLTEKEMGKENNTEEEEVQLEEEVMVADDPVEEMTGTPGAPKAPLSQSQEANMAGAKSVSPKCVSPKANPDRATRPPDSGARLPKSAAKKRGKKRVSTDSVGTAILSEEDVAADVSPTRKSSRQRTMATAHNDEIDPEKADECIERLNATESTDEAALYLRSLGSDRLVAYLLQTIGASDPMRAIDLRQAIDDLEMAGNERAVEDVVAGDDVDGDAAAGGAAESADLAEIAEVAEIADNLADKDVSDTAGNVTHPETEEQQPENNLPAAKPTESERTVSVQVVEDTAVASSTPASKKPKAAAKKAKVISARGHTNRGRVKQKSHKSAEMVEVGALRVQKGWFNAGYIFPDGFKSRTLFRSSVALDSLCVHECDIIGKGGVHWPLPTFRVVALDRPDEPLIAKSCTGCWTAILKRINAEIEARRQAGEDLPPPPKTAIAGPEYFGFNQADIMDAVEALDPEQECKDYWEGKVERSKAKKGVSTSSKPKMVRRSANPVSDKVNKVNGAAAATGTSGRRRGRTAVRTTSSGHEEEEGDEDEANYVSSKWSAVSRTERYRNRLQEAGDEEAAAQVDSENPIPDFMDPITLEPVVTPAISPYGYVIYVANWSFSSIHVLLFASWFFSSLLSPHFALLRPYNAPPTPSARHVMGAATWKAVLAEQGLCPFTKKPLKWADCKILTKSNYDRYKDSIIQ